MEHTRFVGLDIHKERISIAVAESGRSCAVEYLGEISNDPVAIGKLCDRLERWPALTTSIAIPSSTLGPTSLPRPPDIDFEPRKR